MAPDGGCVRIQFCSDVHLEMPLMTGRFAQNLAACAAVSEGRDADDAGADAAGGPGVLPRACEGAYLALLGDIFDGSKVRSGAYREFLLRQAPGFEAVFILAGNHEFYRAEYAAGKAALTALCEEVTRELGGKPAVHFLDCERVDLPDTNIRVLGCTLWSHVTEEQAQAVGSSISDYMAISVRPADGPRDDPPAESRGLDAQAAAAPKPRRKDAAVVADTNAWHQRELAWLEGELAKAEADGRRCVVLTHHAPTFHEACPPEHRTSPVRTAFCTSLERLLRPPVAAWLYGHTHWSVCQCFRLPPDGTAEGGGRWSRLEAELDERGSAACSAAEREVLVASNQLGYGTGEHLRASCRPSLLLELPADGCRAVLRCAPRAGGGA